MADPLSITASLLAVVTAAVQSTQSLYETVTRFKERDKTLRRLQDELRDLNIILDSLAPVVNAEQSLLTLLQGPVERCSQVCSEFEQSMKVFGGKSKMGLRDWTKMEFMRGSINEFIDTVAGYKSTITVALGVITMLVLQEYNEMVQDTTYNLELHLRRIDEKITSLTFENATTSGISIDLKDEREVTKQCLRICEDAKCYIESLSEREPALIPETPQNAAEENSFEAQSRTRKALEDNRDSFSKTIDYLRKRLDLLIQDDGPEKERERSQLQADITISKQCLEVCKMADEISRQKVYKIGEVIAEGDSDQVVVTTLADLFDIKKALSKDGSAQLVGSMTAENLQYLTEKRYNSRFGASPGHLDPAGAGFTKSPRSFEIQKSKPVIPPETGNHEQGPGPKTRSDRPSPNEMRKRLMDGT
ncbi:hypothetical protein PV08_09013 [Exophiala spinifera]|uniref:Azaphilone pigments biosynthesis cluster protein L N-terminal domain-containing protein n=1 Tax=Exophiala spinifera TaxID=91928 RepID=A0A0D1Y9U6_9EURO|nr:uncharacterized protein PV08_09013 [Exophiala spinifera]KIW11741.1 hypothetical protein PV08_09013 [Exophiala spinifera]